MTKLRIDAQELQMAMEQADGFGSWYLDRETGEVIYLSEDGLEEEEEFRAGLEEDEAGRYVPIPSRPSHEGFKDMERFASSLPFGRARDTLFDALDRRKPFRGFKDALFGLGEVRQQWFDYEARCARTRALEWLEDEGIEAELS